MILATEEFIMHRMHNKFLMPAALAIGLAGGAAIAPVPAMAQGSAPERGSERDRGGRSADDQRQDQAGPSSASSRDAFERGFRAGRADERRRAAGRTESRGRESAEYIIIPDFYPESVPFQDEVLMPDYARPMDRLLVAAQSLREAAQAMARQPADPDRNRAIEQVNDALLMTQQAMLQLPQDLRTR